MNPRRNRLLTAIKSAQNHVQSSNVSQLDDKLDSNKSGKIPKSKLARLAGKSTRHKKGNHYCRVLE